MHKYCSALIICTILSSIHCSPSCTTHPTVMHSAIHPKAAASAERDNRGS